MINPDKYIYETSEGIAINLQTFTEGIFQEVTTLIMDEIKFAMRLSAEENNPHKAAVIADLGAKIIHIYQEVKDYVPEKAWIKIYDTEEREVKND